MQIPISEILKRILKLEGVSGVVVVGKDGFVIDSSLENDINHDALGAIIATDFVHTETLPKEFKPGSLLDYLPKLEKEKLLIANIQFQIFAVFVQNNASMSNVQKIIPDISSEIF